MFPHQDAYNRSRGLDLSGSRGFTLIEVMVALALLTVGLIPAFQQAGNAINLASEVRDSLIATNLAQEGVEVVRAIRDANWFNSQPYNTGLTTCAAGCMVQWDSSALITPLGSNLPLKLDPLTGLYQYSTGTATFFQRKITITAVSGHELKIIAQVDWRERSGAKTYSLEYHIYDWLK